ncbi:MAG: hypothetical protein BJ554DRAFT_3843 [Olpidium bornovanus]|uniref:Uncharacterized protein n=1 Tax=Olpidium bornovanus TaxID=278681 RepID=A0A8H7ZNL4_9FUNG|nr:MAG: hypothetical protein BJ554DRAFT_3843 [Olpidium bornovanus]
MCRQLERGVISSLCRGAKTRSRPPSSLSRESLKAVTMTGSEPAACWARLGLACPFWNIFSLVPSPPPPPFLPVWFDSCRQICDSCSLPLVEVLCPLSPLFPLPFFFPSFFF